METIHRCPLCGREAATYVKAVVYHRCARKAVGARTAALTRFLVVAP